MSFNVLFVFIIVTLLYFLVECLDHNSDSYKLWSFVLAIIWWAFAIYFCVVGILIVVIATSSVLLVQ